MSASASSRYAHSQNFLRKRQLVARLIDASSIAVSDLVLDIGAGKGIISAELAGRCRRVIAIEPDPTLAQRLRQRFLPDPNIVIEHCDFLRMRLPVESYKVFASLPFNVTAAIVGKLTSGTSPPDDAFLVVQREAAERFLGTPRQTLAAVRLYPWFELSIAHRFRRTDFEPVPKVGSVLLRLRRRALPVVSPVDTDHYLDLLAYCFTAWTPSLLETLATLMPRGQAARIMRGEGIDAATVPSAVGSDRWLALIAAVAAELSEPSWRKVRGTADRLARQQGNLHKCHRTAVARA